MNNFPKLTAVASAAMLLSGNAFANITAELTVNNSEKLMSNNDVVVTVSYTNTAKTPATMLSYLMKANQNGELEEHIFKVKRDGVEVAYEGMHVKRAAPTKKDYITIAPGKTVSFDVELSGVYDLEQAGSYTFQYHAENVNLFAVNPTTNYKAAVNGIDGLSSNKATAYIAHNPSYDYTHIIEQPKPNLLQRGVSYTGSCSSGEKSALASALSAASTMANDSLSYLQRSVGTRYQTWFGTPTQSRYNDVYSNFYYIKDAIDNKSLTFDCSCNQGYFAYVYPNQPYKIYFCNAFWAANNTGTDSRGGTIIHELSHFNVVAGTDDIVYGQSGAKSLANSNPNSAIQNADSHEYFAENTPYQN